MAEAMRSISSECVVAASPEAVYRAFTNATRLREWLCDVATVSAQKGGRCFLAWNDGYYSGGHYTRLTPGEEVGFTWRGLGDPGATEVLVTLEKVGDGTRVRVTHSGFGEDERWAEARNDMQRAWPRSLENLESTLATGADLRFTERPMLGITISDYNADIAARMGVPVDQGICLDGVVADMGAGAAGLREGDVIVGIDDHEIRDWPTLNNALMGHRAGDAVNVTYYRGPERREANMTLSRRPLHDIPESIEQLADLVRDRYAYIDSELNTLFEGVSEEQASKRIAPDAWSAREVLAHLIHSERGWQTWMSDIVNGQEAWYDDWGINLQARIEATLDAFPTTTELLEALHRLNTETAAFVAHLPADFPEQRKASYWRMAYQLLEEPYHMRAHLAQIREALAAG